MCSSDLPRTIMAVRPAQGSTLGGTTITITGTGFGKGVVVKVGKHNATGVEVVSSTKLRAVAPAGKEGLANVSVVMPKAPPLVLKDVFTYVASANINDVSPASGPITGGTKVTISGEGFTKDAVVTIGNLTLPSIKVVNSTTITFTSPPASEPMTVAISVTNPGEPQVVLPDGFSYVKSKKG